MHTDPVFHLLQQVDIIRKTLGDSAPELVIAIAKGAPLKKMDETAKAIEAVKMKIISQAITELRIAGRKIRLEEVELIH